MRKSLPSGTQHRILERGDNFQLDNTPVYTVPSGHVLAWETTVMTLRIVGY